ncbi:hypothetical protein ACVILK_006189 [Bradyrhizobium embrapense]
MGNAQQVERPDQFAKLLAGLSILQQVGECSRGADRRQIVGHAKVREFDRAHRAAPHPQQRQHGRERAVRAMPDDDDQGLRRRGGSELAIQAVQPQRMLEGGRVRAFKQCRVFFRQEVECVVDANIERVIILIHVKPNKRRFKAPVRPAPRRYSKADDLGHRQNTICINVVRRPLRSIAARTSPAWRDPL